MRSNKVARIVNVTLDDDGRSVKRAVSAQGSDDLHTRADRNRFSRRREVRGRVHDQREIFWTAIAKRANEDIRKAGAAEARYEDRRPIGNISQRLGKPASPAEIQQALESVKGNESATETFAEIRKHLSDNGIDIERTPLALGPSIAIDGEKFVNNDAANAMLTREYRKPFVVPSETEL